MNNHWYVDVSITVMEDSNVVVAVADYVSESFPHSATGSSKRDPSDKYDREVGVNLAIGRALENLSKRLIRKAEGITKHHDDVRNDKSRRLLLQP